MSYSDTVLYVELLDRFPTNPASEEGRDVIGQQVILNGELVEYWDCDMEGDSSNHRTIMDLAKILARALQCSLWPLRLRLEDLEGYLDYRAVDPDSDDFEWDHDELCECAVNTHERQQKEWKAKMAERKEQVKEDK